MNSLARCWSISTRVVVRVISSSYGFIRLSQVSSGAHGFALANSCQVWNFFARRHTGVIFRDTLVRGNPKKESEFRGEKENSTMAFSQNETTIVASELSDTAGLTTTSG
eukprot:scaffold2753_cov154-Amphora_coffeaeformis.AAC.9